MNFRTTILRNGKTATGIHVPEDVMTALGPSRRPPVRVTLNGYTYRTTVATVSGKFMFGVSSEVRRETGVAPGDEVEVDIELDTRPREVMVPADFEAALDWAPEAKQFFGQLSYSHKSAYTLWIESARKDETRQRRIHDAIRMLREGRKQR
jgi:hypothetical protein